VERAPWPPFEGAGEEPFWGGDWGQPPMATIASARSHRRPEGRDMGREGYSGSPSQGKVPALAVGSGADPV
jgi:hypothetical protein